MKQTFVKTTEFTAVQFKKDCHPYHRSIQRVTINGKIPDFEKFFCIIPTLPDSRIEPIEDGDYIIVDSIGNAKGVVSHKHMEQLNIAPKPAHISDLRRYNKAIVKKNPEFVRGAVVAAHLAEELGQNGYRLTDRILLKLNLINKRQVRKRKAIKITQRDMKIFRECKKTNCEQCSQVVKCSIILHSGHDNG